MSELKYPAALARSVAEALMTLLAPHCEPGYLSVAGSLRRGKAMVGDLELCYVSRQGPRCKAGEMFPSECLLADEVLGELRREVLAERPSATGVVSWGTWNKLAVHRASGQPVDFFRTTVEDWARTLAIRTGSKQFNLRLIASAKERGLALHAYGPGLTRIADGTVVPVADERALLTVCGVGWVEPEAR